MSEGKRIEKVREFKYLGYYKRIEAKRYI